MSRPYNRKNEEDLERSKDLLQRELRAILELEGNCKTKFWKKHMQPVNVFCIVELHELNFSLLRLAKDRGTKRP